MNKKLLSFALVVGLAITCTTSALADPLEDQLRNQQSQLQQNKASLKDVQKQREQLDMAIEKLDSQIETTMRQVEDAKIQIGKTQQDIKSSEIDIDKAEKDIKSEQDLFNKRMRVMYINGVSGYLEVILDSDGVGDFLSKVDTVKKVIDFDKKVIGNLNGKKLQIQKKKDALKLQNDRLLTLKAENEQKLIKLNENKNEQNKLIMEMRKQEKTYASVVSQSQRVVNATLQQIQAIRDAAPKYNPSRGGADLSSNSILAYASNFLGTRYVWGGNSPNPGFDCSGFTKYVYGHFGVSIGRTTYDQINNGIPVTKDQLQPGDLVFFGSSSNPHHVGIYVGNNCYIHAPQTGDVIKVSDMSRSDYLTGRRVK